MYKSNFEGILMAARKMKKSTKQIALPGDVISTAEEYLPGGNATEINGMIVSLTSGIVKRDEKNLLISVETGKSKVLPNVGDIVYGQIIKLDQRSATIRLGAIFKDDTGLVQYDGEAFLRVFGLMGSRREGDGPSIRIGDLIRAKVIKANHTTEVAIVGKHFGVVRAVCGKCRGILIPKHETLYCNNCERSEMRKAADDYGNILVFGDINEGKQHK